MHFFHIYYSLINVGEKRENKYEGAQTPHPLRSFLASVIGCNHSSHELQLIGNVQSNLLYIINY